MKDERECVSPWEKDEKKRYSYPNLFMENNKKCISTLVGAAKYGIIFSAPLFIYGVKIYPSYFTLHTLDDRGQIVLYTNKKQRC
jgi:hypothetical protein